MHTTALGQACAPVRRQPWGIVDKSWRPCLAASCMWDQLDVLYGMPGTCIPSLVTSLLYHMWPVSRWCGCIMMVVQLLHKGWAAGCTRMCTLHATRVSCIGVSSTAQCMQSEARAPATWIVVCVAVGTAAVISRYTQTYATDLQSCSFTRFAMYAASLIPDVVGIGRDPCLIRAAHRLALASQHVSCSGSNTMRTLATLSRLAKFAGTSDTWPASRQLPTATCKCPWMAHLRLPHAAIPHARILPLSSRTGYTDSSRVRKRMQQDHKDSN